MAINLTPEENYYNLFDLGDDYYELRSIAGRVEQGREDNEMQAILRAQIKALGDTLYKDGSLVKYGDNFAPSIPAQSVDSPGLYTLEEAYIYYDGIVHKVPTSQVTVPLTGLSSIGVLLTYTVVDYTSDPGLVDPAVGEDNVGNPGANRLKITKAWASSSVVPSSNQVYVPVYEVDSGLVTKPVIPGQFEAVTQAMERRTQDTSGNFVVNGFEVTAADYSTDKLEVTVGKSASGIGGSKAYVQGVEIIKLQPIKQLLDKSLETQAKDNESVAFTPAQHASVVSGLVISVDHNTSGGLEDILTSPSVSTPQIPASSVLTALTIAGYTLGTDYTISSFNSGLFMPGALSVNANAVDWINNPTDPYGAVVSYIDGSVPVKVPLSESPVQQIRQVDIIINKTVSVTKGALNGDDILPGSNTAPVTQIRSVRQGSTLYANSTDWVYGSSQTISWAPGGSEPTTGSTYFVNADFKTTLSSADYSVVLINGSPFLQLSAGIIPVPGTLIETKYDFFLSRIDVISLDRSGSLYTSRGDKAKLPTAPIVDSGKYLPLAEVSLGAGGGTNNFSIKMYSSTRKTVLEQNKINERVDRLEQNLAMTQLDSRAYQTVGANIANLAGQITEGFRYTSEDLRLEGQSAISRLKFDKELTSSYRWLDATLQEMTLPEQEYNVKLKLATTGNINITTSADSNIVSLARSVNLTPVLAQNNASLSAGVSIVGQKIPTAQLTYVRDLSDENDLLLADADDTATKSGIIFSKSNVPPGNIDTLLARQLSAINEGKTDYLLSGRTVYVSGRGFLANTEVFCYVADQQVPLTAITSAPSGLVLAEMLRAQLDVSPIDCTQTPNKLSTQNTVTSNAQGKFLASFVIPENIEAGSVIIKLQDSFNNIATYIYDTQGPNKGTKVELPSTVTSIETSKVNIPKLNSVSPSPSTISSPQTVAFNYGYSGSHVGIRVISKPSSGLAQVTSSIFPSTLSPNVNTVNVSNVGNNSDYYTWLIGAGGASNIMTGTFGTTVSSGPSLDKFTVEFNPATGKLEVDFVMSSAQRIIIFTESVPVSTGSLNSPLYDQDFGSQGTWSGRVSTTLTNPTSIIVFIENLNKGLVYADSQTYFKVDYNVTKLGIAQSFRLSKDKTLSGVDLYINTQGSSSAQDQVVLTIREINPNGSPSNVILGRAVKSITDINSNAATRFNFDPLKLDGNKYYCLVIDPSVNLLSQAFDYSNSSAQRVDGQLYNSTGPNGWSVIPNKAIRFQLFDFNFNLSSSVSINEIKFAGAAVFDLDSPSGLTVPSGPFSGQSAMGFYFKANTLSQDNINTGITWQYSLNNGLSWVTFGDGTYVDFNQASNQLKLRALFFSANPDISPLLDIRSDLRARTYIRPTVASKTNVQQRVVSGNSISVTNPTYTPAGFVNTYASGDGMYVFKKATLLSAYKDVRVVIQAKVPIGSAITPMFTDELSGSTINSWTWNVMTLLSAVALSDGYTEYTYTTNLSPNSNRKGFRLRLDLLTDSVFKTPRVRTVIGVVSN